jgi:LacI family transcriptional regulator
MRRRSLAVTLRDVALRGGVSIGTVSRVLNNKADLPILPETVERIKQAARDLEYSPNHMARSLATGRTNTLGLFSDEMTDPHFAQMLEAAEAAAVALGYHLVVSGTLETITQKMRTDGVLILGSPSDLRFTVLPDDLPKVFVHNTPEVSPNQIAWSDFEGIGRAVDHLFGLGHRRIAALFCYGIQQEPPHPKVLGFRAAIDGRGIQAWECWRTWDPDQSRPGAQCENGYRSTVQLMENGANFTAIVARTDFLAMGALRALRQAGLSVPKMVSVIGYTDSIHAVCADPPLTSVRTPIADASKIAVEHLVRSINGREVQFAGSMLPTTLQVRLSCAACPERA